MRPAFARGGNEPLGDCLDLRSVDGSDLLNAFPDQAAIIDQSGQILAVNAAWEAFAHENGGTPASTGVGANYFASCDATVLQDRDREVLGGIRSVLDGAPGYEGQYPCHSPDERRWFRIVARPIAGQPRRVLLIHSNITTFKLGEERVENSLAIADYLAAVVTGSADAIISFDLDGIVTAWNPAAETLWGYSADEMVGRTIETIYPPDWPLRAQDYIEDIVTGRRRTYRVIRQRKDGREVEVDISAAPIVRGGRIVGVANVVRPAAAAVSAPDLAIGRELNHRLKNLFSVVTTIARQTGRQSSDIADFQKRFDGRLASLATSNDLLLGSAERFLTIEELVRAQLRAFIGDEDPRVSIGGPEYFVQREAIQALGMALHELATNAVKYGALSHPAGRLEVTWEQSERSGPGLLLAWNESGSRDVVAPQRKGFGYQVLTMIAPRAVNGSAELEFTNGGMRWTLWKPSVAIAAVA